MAIRPFLAMTGAEMRNSPQIPEGICWMACHFSPYGLGLSNLPPALPPGSLLMVDDITPIRGHRADIIAIQLEQAVDRLGCAGVLLDFQRPDCEAAAGLVAWLVSALPCPVAVSDLYARELACPVFLSAPPCHVPLKEHAAPWKDREIWLELSTGAELLTVDQHGCQTEALSCPPDGGGFEDNAHHCHYLTEVREDAAAFTLWRTHKDLAALLIAAENSGITTAVGLYQELKHFP